MEYIGVCMLGVGIGAVASIFGVVVCGITGACALVLHAASMGV